MEFAPTAIVLMNDIGKEIESDFTSGIIDLMEEYHQQKSREEAEERFNEAMKYRDTAIANREDPAVWTKKIVRIAAGKEEG